MRPIWPSLIASAVMCWSCSGSSSPTDAGPKPSTKGALQVVLEVVGTGSDIDGVTVTVSGPAGYTVTRNTSAADSVVFADLEAGQYTVAIGNLTTFCAAPGDRVITVGNSQTRITVELDCVGQFVYNRTYGAETDIWYVDERGMEHRLTSEGNNRNWGWAPDGQWILATSIDGSTVWTSVLSLDATSVLLEPARSCTGRLYDGRWSPDGAWVLAREEGSECAGPARAIVLYDSGDGSAVRTILESNDRVAADWSPDGSEIAILKDNQILVERMDDQSRRHLLDVDAARLPNSLHWSPAGTLIMVGLFSPAQFVVLDAETGEVVGQTPTENPAVVASWRPDGTGIAFVSDDKLYYLDLDSPSTTRLFPDFSERIGYPSWSADGSKLLFHGLTSLFLGDTGSGTTRLVRSTVQEDASQDREPRWSGGSSYPR